MNCFCILSSVLRALSTLDFTVGSMSGISMEKASLGFFNLSVMLIPQSTVLLVDTDEVSAMRVARDVLVLYVALMSRSLSIMSPLNFMELPSLMMKSLNASP